MTVAAGELVVEQATSAEIVTVYTHEEVYPFISDDFSIPREKFKPRPSNSIYLKATLDDELAGIIQLDPQNGITVEAHFAFLPEFQNKNLKRHIALNSSLLAIRWVWNNTKFSKIIAMVSKNRKDVRRLACKAGFEVEGSSKNSYMKNGKLYDQWLLGLEKGEI